VIADSRSVMRSAQGIARLPWRAAAAWALAAAACASPSPPEPAPSAATPTLAPAAAVPGPVACQDFGSLDPATLPALPPSRHAALLQEVWVRVLQKHYDPKLGCKDWPAIRLRYAAELVGVEEAEAAYAIVNRMLDELGQSHFRLFPPDGGDGDDHAGPAKPDLSVRWIDDRLVVVESHADGRLGPVRAGSTLLAVDDRPLDELVADAKAHTTRPSEFAFEVARRTEARLSCDRAGQSKKVRVTDPADAEREVIRMLTCEEPRGERISLGNLENIPTQVDARMVEGTTVGVLAFNVWMLPMVKRVEDAMTDLRRKGMTALVLDLRGNPGGVGAMSVPVARLLLSEPGSLGRLQFRDFTQDFNVEAGSNPFKGPVVILVDEGTASTSEIFAAGLRDLGRAKVVGGRASAGAALPSVIDELPGGAILQYVVGDYRTPKGTLVEGVGVVPDINVVETRADFAAGRDPVLDAAVEFLKQPV
jgi:carboxyl-terminal processing protease